MPRRRAGRRRRAKRSKKIMDVYKNFVSARVPRWWPPSEMYATLDGHLEWNMNTQETAYPNNLTAFQAFGIGGQLDMTDIALFVDGDGTTGNPTPYPAQVMRPHDTLKGDYSRMAIVSSTYKISFSSDHATPNGFILDAWLTDHRDTGPGWTCNELRTDGDGNTTALPVSPIPMYNALSIGHRRKYLTKRSFLGVDSSTNFINLTWHPDYVNTRIEKGNLGGNRLKPKTTTIGSVDGGPSALMNAAVASALTTDFGMRPWLNILIRPSNITHPTSAAARVNFITKMKVHATHKVLYYQRIEEAAA